MRRNPGGCGPIEAMKISSRALVLLACSVTTAAMLTGCPDKDTASPDKSAATVAPSAAPAPPAKPAAKGGW